jgi:TadE-like protein
MRGQATVEFAMVAGVFLLLLLAAVSASVYTLQRSAAVTGVAAGARTAAGGTPSAAGTPDLPGATVAAARVVAPVMAGTRLRQVPPPGDCRDLRAIPRGEVDICATQAGDMVTVRLRGRPANTVPIPGLDWSLDLVAQAHAVTFAP